MRKFEQLKAEWKVKNPNMAAQQLKLWDRAAANYWDKPLPELEKDTFLQHMAEMIDLNGISTLDVGCGDGGYTLALARRVKRAVGVDISPKMIEKARARADRDSSSADFLVVNWMDADIDELGFRGAFDVAFAHMSPAICDFETMDKLNACTRRVGMLEKHTRRHDRVLGAAFDAAGLSVPFGQDEEMIHVFTYLWGKGYEPHIAYRADTWTEPRSTEDMIAWCSERAGMRGELTDDQKAAIIRVVKEAAVDGIVTDVSTTTRVTVMWTVNG